MKQKNIKRRIHVTQEDINESEQGQPDACMVWRALDRQLQLPEGVSIDVFPGSIEMHGPHGFVDVPTSERTSTYIQKFDVDKTEVSPFDFDLNLPADWYTRLMGKQS